MNDRAIVYPPPSYNIPSEVGTAVKASEGYGKTLATSRDQACIYAATRLRAEKCFLRRIFDQPRKAKDVVAWRRARPEPVAL